MVDGSQRELESPGEKPLDLPMKEFLDWAKGGAKIYPKCGQHQSRAWGSRLIEEVSEPSTGAHLSSP